MPNTLPRWNQMIFHFPLVISHFSLLARGRKDAVRHKRKLTPRAQAKMKNEKWKMTNGK
jgi:hypothetical protein